MDRWEDENEKNIYVIRRKLTTYRKAPNDGFWDLDIGNFRLRINLSGDEYWKHDKDPNDSIIKHDKLDVVLYEVSKSNPNAPVYIDLRRDLRFKDYAPIQYNVIETPTGGRINQSDGKEMPQVTLYELIRLLYRLSNLTAFM